MTTRLFILVPVHNRRTVTETFVDCLARQSFTDYQLVLIDDGSKDGTSDMVKSKIGNVTVLAGDGGLWWAGSLQLGLDWLQQQALGQDDIVLIANDDITFDARFLESSLEIFEPLSRTLLLSRNLDDKTGRIEESGIHANLDDFTFTPATHAEEINCLSTRALFIKVSDLEEIGGFHTKLLPHYWSDYEFTMRAGKKGFRLMTSDRSVITVNHQTSGYRVFDDSGFANFFSAYFSKKSVINPIYRMVFICMTGSPSQVIRNIPKTLALSIGYVAKKTYQCFVLFLKGSR
jgi:GT2 family glycosyltransferase